MGAQEHAAAIGPGPQIEGVLHLARRMVWRDIEGGEVLEVVLDIRTFGDAETHLAENGDDLIDSLADRVQATFALGAWRQRQVDRFEGQPSVQGGLFEIALASTDR